MGTLRQIAVAILFISSLTFIALFGRLPALRRTPVAWLYRVLCIYTPSTLELLDTRITGGAIVAASKDSFNFLLHERHPLVLLLFLTLLSSCAFVFIFSAWHQLEAIHHLIIPLLVPAPYMFTYLCAREQHRDQQVLRSNHALQLARYPYDHTIYHPNNVCRTCQFSKPARSKHCPLCKICVARQDHHCAWVNNCIGLENYRWFLGLLASLAVLLAYGAFLAISILGPRRPSAATSASSSGLVTGLSEYMRRWLLVFRQDISIGAVGLLALMCAPLPGCLLLYHVYLVWAGLTTNETSKWRALQDDIWDGVAYVGQRLAVKRQPARSNASHDGMFTWPLETGQIVICSEEGPPKRSYRVQECDGSISEVKDWNRVTDLHELENVYDLNLRRNLHHILRP